MNHLTPTDTLKFAIDFAQAESLSANDANRQIRNLVRHRESPAIDYTSLSVAELAALQQQTRTLLRALVDRGYFVVTRTVKTLLIRAGAPRQPIPTYTSPSRDQIEDASELSDRFINRVIRSFEDVGLDKLQVCQAPPAGRDDAICGRLFLKVTRKEFCSSQCQKRVWARNAARATREKETRHARSPRKK